MRLSTQPRLLLSIDRYLGIPTCWAATALRKLRGLFGGARPTPAAPRSILFLKLAEQGSTVLAYDALADAVRRVGRENVYFMVFEENRFIADLLGILAPENVLAIKTGSTAEMARSTLAQLRWIRRRRIDACIDLEFFARSSAVLCLLTGAPIRVGFHTYFGEGPYRGDLLTHRVLYNPHLHTGDTFLSLVAALDVPAERLPTFDFRPPGPLPLPRFQPARAEQDEVREIISEARGKRLVLLNANCSDLLPLRKWADDHYVALAKGLIARHGEKVAVAFTGSATEAPRVRELVAAVDSPQAFSVAGRTTLRQLLVLYGLAEILITNDSGPAHFAALTPIDVIALFGPETPLLFAARTPRSHPLWAGIACSPCVNAFNTRQSACRDNVCMQRLTVDRVGRLADEILVCRTGGSD